MKKWIKNLGLILLGLGIVSFLFGGVDLSVEAERGAFYIAMFMIIAGLIIELVFWLQDRKSKISKTKSSS